MKLARACLLPFAFLVVGVVRLIARWRLVRFGEIWSSRLGHLIGNTENYLCERGWGLQPWTYDIWFRLGTPANRVIARKYEQLLHVWPRGFAQVVVKVNVLFPGWEKHVARPAQNDRDIHNLWRLGAPHIGFTAREERKGKKLLRELGIPEDAQWVCLIVRDAAYLQAKAPQLDFSYHDYRDSDISTYALAAAELARLGYYVIRMGEIVAKPLLIKHTKIIDYAASGKRTEFGDLYLGAKCAFCLGTSTGFMAIPQVFNRPVGIVNYVPIEYTPTWQEGLVIWKHHVKDGKRLAVREIVQAGVSAATFGQEFERAGVKLEDNTLAEIAELAKEMAEQDRNRYYVQDQHAFWSDFPRSMVNGKPLHGKIVIRVGREYFERMPK